MILEEEIKVLYVEDNPGDFRLVQVILKKENADHIHLENAESLTTGQECLAHGNFDLVLLDLNLPDSNGLDTFRRIKASAQDIPSIVLTGLDDETVGLQAINEGAQDYLIKRKINGDILVRAIKYAIWRKKAEREIRDKEETYRAIFENTGTATVILEEDSFISLANAEFEKLTGYTKDEIEGKKRWTEFVVEEDLERMKVQHRLRREDSDAALKRYEFRLADRSGQIKVILLTVDTIPGTKKSVASLLDITERKSAEETLRASEQKFSAIFEQAPIVYELYDQKGLLIQANGAFERLWQLPKSLAIGKYNVIKDPQVKARGLLQYVERAYAGEIISDLAYEFDAVANELAEGLGRKRWITSTFYPIKDSSGQVTNIVIIHEDITDHKKMEEAQRESLEKLNLAIQGAEMGVWQLDLITNKRYFDDQVCHMLGIDPLSFKGTPEEFYGAVHPGDRDHLKAALMRTIEQDVLYKPEYRVVWPDGSVHHVTARARSFRDNTGKPLRINGFLWDITERKHAEEALKDSEARYRTLFNAGMDSIFLFSLSADGLPLNFIDVNAVARQKYGYTRDEFLTMSPFDMIAPEYHEMMPSVGAELNKNGNMRAEWEDICKDGHRIPVDVSLTLFELGGKPICMAVVRDITERKLAERKLSEQAFMLANINDAVIGTDADYLITYWSQSAEKMYGYSQEEILGQYSGILKPEFLRMTGKEALELLESTCSLKTELIHTTKDGRKIVIDSSNQLLYDENGKHYGMIGINRDITERKRAEETLREIEANIRIEKEFTDKLLDVSPDTVFVFEPLTGKAVRWNDAFRKVSGYSDEEIASLKAPDSYYTPQDLIQAREAMKRVLKEGKGSVELRFSTKDGNAIPFEYNVSLVLDKSGEPRWLISIGRDITERKQAENELKWNAALLEAQVEASLDGILVVDEKGKRVITNQRLFDMWKVPEEIRNAKDDAPLLDYVVSKTRNHEEFLKKVLYLYDHHNETSRDTIEFEDGTIFDRYSSPVFGRDGHYYGRIWTFRDITEAKRAERTLQEQYNFLQQLIDSIPNPIFYKDSKGVYLGCNKALEAITGHSKDKIIGRSVYELYPKDLADIYHEADKKLLENPGVQIYESSIANTDGIKREVMFSKATHYDTEGHLAGIAGVILDITDRKEAEDQIKTSLQEKEILLKEVHHRVKNNLQIISALLSLQSSYLSDEDVIKIFRDCQNRIKSMALVHENLYRSKDFGKIDFTEYIDQLVLHLSQSYSDLGGRVGFKVHSENVYLNINTAIPCGMIINELVSNSFKYAFPDGRRGEIGIVLSSDDEGYNLVVSDNGIGIKGDLNIKGAKTLGFRLIDTLIKQINGKMILDATNGFRCEIHFKGLK